MKDGTRHGAPAGTVIPPVVFDATHSVQLPGAQGTTTGGDRQFIPYLALGAAAVGVDGIFMEVHPDPPRALCDATNQFYLKDLPALLGRLAAVDVLTKQWERNRSQLIDGRRVIRRRGSRIRAIEREKASTGDIN